MITGLIAMIIMLAMSLISQFRTLPSSLAVVLALYAVSMFSSSFVEEEHEFWFYILNTYWLHLIATNSTQWPQAFLQMLFNRLIYSYNPCGNKHISSTTNFAYLISRHWPFAQTILYALTMQAVCLMLASRLLLSVSRYTRPLTRLIIYALFTAVGALLTVIKHEFIFGNQKLSMTKIIFTRSTYGLILTGILIFKFQKIFLKSFKPNRTQRNELLPVLILLLSLLLTRLPNALPLLLQFIQITWLTRNLQMDQFATLIFIQQHFAFFSAGGNSNAISTIDLSSAYLGLDESQMYLAGLLAFLGTFAAPLVVISSGSSALMAKRYDSNDNGLVQNWWVVGRMISAVALAASVTLFRYHLFIWSVFSPKFLYELVWIFVYQVAVSKLI
jgi:ethanolaminephosphotransferase